MTILDPLPSIADVSEFDVTTFVAGQLLQWSGTQVVTVISTADVVLSDGSVPFDNTGLRVLDTNASHYLEIKPGSDLTDNRILTVTTGDAARTLTMAGDATISGTTSGTNTGDQTITLTGNVTGSGTGSFVATIPANTVTYAMMQDISATSRILGRITSGAGDTEELTGANVRTITGLATSDAVTHSTMILSSGDVSTNGLEIQASGSTNIPNPGVTSAKTLFNYRGFSLCVDSAVLSSGPTFGLGVAINRAGPCLGLKNATGESVNVEAGNLQLGSGVVAINTVTDATYAGVFLGHNYTGNYYTQRNTSYPSWGIDLGGVDNASYSGTNDTINFVRQAAGAAHTARVSVFQLPNAVPANANQAAATDPASTQTLVNAIRQILIDRNLMKGSA